MGHSQSKYQETQAKSFLNKVTYIEAIQQTNSSIDIYRFKQVPYDFIMKHKRVFPSNDSSHECFLSELKKLKDIQHKNIAQIHQIDVNKQLLMCGRAKSVQSYWNYYEITLAKVIEKRRKDDIRFTENQIWYVLKCLLEVSTTLNSKQYDFGDYRSKSITLSSQGYIKINRSTSMYFCYHAEKHSEYMKAMLNSSKIYENLPFPPEFIPNLKQGNLKYVQDRQKEDSFMIGKFVIMIATVILEMLIDEDIKKYYSFSNKGTVQYKRCSVWKDLGLLGYIYDKKSLIWLLQRMLEDDVSKRISVFKALDFINENRENINVGGCVRMFDDEDNPTKPKVSYRSKYDFERGLLKQVYPNILELKLNVCPINTLTKRGGKVAGGGSLTSSKYSIQTKDKSLKKSKALEIKTRGSSLKAKSGIKRI